MKIGIIGAGQIGQALAKKLTKAGYTVILSNSRGIASLAPLVDGWRAHIGEPRGFRRPAQRIDENIDVHAPMLGMPKSLRQGKPKFIRLRLAL